MSVPAAHYDAAYFHRWYGDTRTRSFTKADKAVRAAFVLSYLRYLKLPVRSVCDLGCGLGHWREALQEISPRLRYTGVEYSPYLCEKYGWVQASAADYTPKKQFDLVICQSVLHHLNEADCKRAIRHIGQYCRGALYFEAVTQRDWNTVIDKEHTDPRIYRRTGAWYKRELGRYFTPIGGGLFLAKAAGVPLFELERL